MEEKQFIGYREAKVIEIEDNYIKCEIEIYPRDTMEVKGKNGRKKKATLPRVSKIVNLKFDRSNIELLQKFIELDFRYKVRLKYKIKSWRQLDLTGAEIIDFKTIKELKDNTTYLFDTKDMVISATEKNKYKTYVQKGKDIIKKNHIKGVNSTTIKYAAQQDLYDGITFTINEIPEEPPITKQLFTSKEYKELSVNEFIELLKQEEAKGIDTYVIVKTKVD